MDEIPPDQCDVHDPRALQAYRSKRYEWICWLSDHAQNDIWTQLYRMTWNDAVFRVINEGLHLAEHSESVHAIQNRMLIEFLTEGYLANQILGVRRLTDNRRNTVSLYRLVQDIGKNRDLITRENYVSFDGVPYDYDPAQQEAMDRALQRTTAPRDVALRIWWRAPTRPGSSCSTTHGLAARQTAGPDCLGRAALRALRGDWRGRQHPRPDPVVRQGDLMPIGTSHPGVIKVFRRA